MLRGSDTLARGTKVVCHLKGTTAVDNSDSGSSHNKGVGCSCSSLLSSGI